MRLRSFVTPKPATRDYGLSDYLSWVTTFQFGGNTYTVPLNTTMPGQMAEAIPSSFVGYIHGSLMASPIIAGLEAVRVRVFAQGRFQWQQLVNGRPGRLFGTPELAPLEAPWPGGITRDLLALMLLHGDFGGNAYVVRQPSLVRPGDGQLLCMRPDWVQILLAPRVGPTGGRLGMERAGYAYFDGGLAGRDAANADEVFAADEVAHFIPYLPDTLANYRGMSWVTPIIRELQADQVATTHKLKFFEHAATPNLAVSLKEITDPQRFQAFVDMMDEQHKGVVNAYKTLYMGAGADVTVIGADMRSIDFTALQGKAETRLALAAGVHPTVAALSEGLQGSSLNAGNFGQARRQFSDITLADAWNNVAGSLQTVVRPPAGARLTVDTRDIPFLQEDEKDAAEILNLQAEAIRKLTDGGYDPTSVVSSVLAGDLSGLTHTGLVPVQLQPPGSDSQPSTNGQAALPA